MYSLSVAPTATPIADPSACRIPLETIRADLQACRNQTLALCKNISALHFSTQSHSEFSPVGWHLGHIAYTESLWIAERCRQLSHTSADISSRYTTSKYRRLFSADGLPKSERQNLPSLAEILEYLAVVRSQTEACLPSLDNPQAHLLLHWLIQHEAQHAETISMVMAMHKLISPTQSSNLFDGQEVRSQDLKEQTVEEQTVEKQAVEKQTVEEQISIEPNMVPIEAGEFYQGSDSLDAIDNERSVHPVFLERYWIDRAPVTCGQYRRFIEAGGYQTEKWWSPHGWQWQQRAKVKAPLYWQDDRAFDTHPVCGTSWYEADAYARFIGKRLPTEAEWAKAAGWNVSTQTMQRYPWGEKLSHTVQSQAEKSCNYGYQVGATTPVATYQQFASPYGCLDMLGNVWEWTDTWFNPYPGFRAFPYEGYSKTYFDGAHRVLRGGSWATSRWALRNSFRNWYHPYRREMFAGFRCAA